MTIESELTKAEATVAKLKGKITKKLGGSSQWWMSSKFLVAASTCIALWLAGNLVPSHVLYCLTAIVVAYLISRAIENVAAARRDGELAHAASTDLVTRVHALGALVQNAPAGTPLTAPSPEREALLKLID
jgi:4-hydroxybenzoate polyprenyltransferase